jgi:alginate O-acetyltransferase complex protein AlgI
MLFNSFTFLFFFAIFFSLYWFVFSNSLKLQNGLVVAGGCVFYGWWDWRFLPLLFFSTLIGFVAAKWIDRESSVSRRKIVLAVAVLLNVSILIFFKYLNFFIQSWIELMAFFGLSSQVSILNIILPIGISFYTFQKISYVVDVYYKRIKPADNFFDFAAYVVFFPQLLAGPIERANHLLPQFYVRRKFSADFAISGIQQIIYGLFKKIVVADNCAMLVNSIWSQYDTLPGPVLILGSVFFAFQIYGDFSGYTDIALGCSKLLGLQLIVNFRYPYFSRSIGEFWRRWHISLSSWFRDYIYFPLGGSRDGQARTVRNIFVVFILSGLWHGANWTFLAWGLINAIFFIPYALKARSGQSEVAGGAGNLPNLKEIVQMGATFAIVCLGWIFFRSDSLSQAFDFIRGCFRGGNPLLFFLKTNAFAITFAISIFAIVQLLVIDWLNRRNDSIIFRKTLGSAIFFIIEICFLGAFKNNFEFIYFQF